VPDLEPAVSRPASRQRSAWAGVVDAVDHDGGARFGGIPDHAGQGVPPPASHRPPAHQPRTSQNAKPTAPRVKAAAHHVSAWTALAHLSAPAMFDDHATTRKKRPTPKPRFAEPAGRPPPTQGLLPSQSDEFCRPEWFDACWPDPLTRSDATTTCEACIWGCGPFHPMPVKPQWHFFILILAGGVGLPGCVKGGWCGVVWNIVTVVTQIAFGSCWIRTSTEATGECQ